ncbi:hypothetical protein F9K94_12320 [Brucella tritici]|uniref:Uncharacterized protein n=1 Tax=Brucella tritici TaxID=94626 RepID=A0A7V8B2H7_9HYPH|nr:hypothetical protein [Brucella tritici]KAB2657160.1 hypothetical protein F9K94_12320 [Brucella tritici]
MKLKAALLLLPLTFAFAGGAALANPLISPISSSGQSEQCQKLAETICKEWKHYKQKYEYCLKTTYGNCMHQIPPH